MTTTTIVTIFGALLLGLVLRRRRTKRQYQMDLFDAAMRSRFNRKG